MNIPSISAVAKTGKYFTANKADIQTGAYIGLVFCFCAAIGCTMIIAAPDFYN